MVTFKHTYFYIFTNKNLHALLSSRQQIHTKHKSQDLDIWCITKSWLEEWGVLLFKQCSHKEQQLIEYHFV